MKFLLLKDLILLLSIAFPHLLFSQKVIEIKFEKDRTGTDYAFECINNGFINYTVEVNFTSLVGLSADVPIPYKVTVGPGSTRLFKLKPSSIGGSTNFNYTFSFQKGCSKTKIDTTIAYLLPVSPSKSTTSFELSNLGEKYVHTSPPKDWYALGFKVAEGDTVFAARKGVVGEVVEDRITSGESLSFSRNVNYIEIQHEDCTMAKYELFQENGVFVEVGETVQAGQPLGIISSKNFTSNHHLRLSVFYSHIDAVMKEGKKTSEKHYWAYVPIRFWVDAKITKLEPKKEYLSEHPEALIVKEMTKREKKKRLELLKK